MVNVGQSKPNINFVTWATPRRVNSLRLTAFLLSEPMPTKRVTMRQIREILRLHLQTGLSYNEVGRALKISKSVVTV
jgi:hypothetical protein